VLVRSWEQCGPSWDLRSSDLSYRGQLGEGNERPSRARSRGVVASRGRVRGGCGVKVAVRG
jgi:hypothetical protein